MQKYNFLFHPVHHLLQFLREKEQNKGRNTGHNDEHHKEVIHGSNLITKRLISLFRASG